MAKKQQTQEDTPLIFDLDLPDETLKGMVTRRASESAAHWEKEYNLKSVRETNKGLYNSDYVKNMVRDERYQQIFSDNKIFTSVRTILAFITSNMTKPEVTPANSDSLSLQFAKDFEKILVEEADNCYGRDKVKLALQDLMTGQRVGILKWLYNPGTDKLELKHIDPKSIIIGKRSPLRDEPDFLQETQERTIGELIQQFPDKKDDIYRIYNIQKGVPSQLEQVKKITENWIFIETDQGSKLAVVFMAENTLVLGKMSDPNWVDDGNNLLDEHMMPYVFFNFLNDGSGWIDHTSFVEQAMYNQKQYDMRGQTIAENAAYAGTGVPVFGKGAVKEETASKIHFSPIQRILLDSEDVSKSFTTWNTGALPSYVVEDKQDMKQSVLDVFGTNQVQTATMTDSQTLGQDVMLRNQAEGRQQELVDCTDNGMSRCFSIEAQMIYRYYDSAKYYNFIGEDGEFEHLDISQAKIAKNFGIKIKIKSGSSLPVDRSQKIAQALELAKMNRIGTLKLYKELGVDDPEESYKEFLREHLLPFGDLGEMDKENFSREAEEDLQLVIGGKQPNEREDMTQDYLTHIQDWMMTQKFEQLPAAAQTRVRKFVAGIIAQAQRKMLKLQTQQPVLPQSNSGQLPPIRPKISLSGKDLQPDVLAQLVQASGYQPSQLTQAEMQAGLVDAPAIRETLNGNPLTDPDANSGTPASAPAQVASAQLHPGTTAPLSPEAQAQAAPQPAPQPPAVVNIHNHVKK